MEAGFVRDVALTAVAPIAWGSTYYVTRHFLPVDAPLWGATLRALPAGLLLLAVCQRRPAGSWWWRSFVLGLLNFAAFFLLVYLAAQLLPSSIAASVMALAPLALGGFAFVLLGQHLNAMFFLSAVAGVVGVSLLVGLATQGVDPRGVAASAGALLLSASGSVLATRWRGDIPLLSATAWQLTAGGLLLLVTAAAVEGGPPHLRPSGLIAMAYVTVVATAIAFVCWFHGLTRMSAGSVGLIGLLNPVSGIALGVFFAGEMITGWQLLGAALVLVAILTALRQRQTVMTMQDRQVEEASAEPLDAAPAVHGLTRPPARDREVAGPGATCQPARTGIATSLAGLGVGNELAPDGCQGNSDGDTRDGLLPR